MVINADASLYPNMLSPSSEASSSIASVVVATFPASFADCDAASGSKFCNVLSNEAYPVLHPQCFTPFDFASAAGLYTAVNFPAPHGPLTQPAAPSAPSQLDESPLSF